MKSESGVIIIYFPNRKWAIRCAQPVAMRKFSKPCLGYLLMSYTTCISFLPIASASSIVAASL